MDCHGQPGGNVEFAIIHQADLCQPGSTRRDPPRISRGKTQSDDGKLNFTKQAKNLRSR
jgi:hypothetical protein